MRAQIYMQSLPEIQLGGKKKNSQPSFLPASKVTPRTPRSAVQCISACLHHISALFLQPAVRTGLLCELARSSEEKLITSMRRDTQSCWWTLPRTIEYFSMFITSTTISTTKKSSKSQVSMNITPLHWFRQCNTNGESGLTCGNSPLPASPKSQAFPECWWGVSPGRFNGTHLPSHRSPAEIPFEHWYFRMMSAAHQQPINVGSWQCREARVEAIGHSVGIQNAVRTEENEWDGEKCHALIQKLLLGHHIDWNRNMQWILSETALTMIKYHSLLTAND